MANFQICIDLTNVDGNITSAVRISQTRSADATEIRRFGEILEKVYRVMRDFDSYCQMDASALAVRSLGKVSGRESAILSRDVAAAINSGGRGVRKSERRNEDAEQKQE